MSKIKYEDFELYLSHVAGAMAIDMEGILVFMNRQCCEYLQLNLEQSLGRHIKDVFPETKMLESLKKDRSDIIYYHTEKGLGISFHVPIFIGNEKVGLLEYDVIQGSEFLYDFAEDYKLFLDEELNYLKDEIRHFRSTKYSIENILGNSVAINKLKLEIYSASRSNSTVLITGETGSGKELVAHSIHNLSKRSLREFIRVNASAFPEHLFESELFGYEGGAFTGAKKEGKKGKFELADKGTLFIDEINQMPLNLQPKILRVLQEQEVDRVGASKSITIDVRIIAATNKNLKTLVKEGKFREDLFYRLDVIEITVPPLRERPEDIPVIVETAVEGFNKSFGKNIMKIEPQIYQILMDYEWPGNVRELYNVVERAMNSASGTMLKVENFLFLNRNLKGEAEKEDLEKEKRTLGEKEHASGVLSFIEGEESPIERAKQEAEKEVILKALNDCGGNKSHAAAQLKIGRTLLYQKMRRLGIK